MGRAGRQRQTAGWLRERVVVVEAECRAVRAERDQLAGQVERLTGETWRLQARVGELEAKVEELRRAGKRQPAPGRPGRKPGGPAVSRAAYGQHGRLLGLLAEHHDMTFGVWATVDHPGRLAVDDTVRSSPAEQGPLSGCAGRHLGRSPLSGGGALRRGSA